MLFWTITQRNRNLIYCSLQVCTKQMKYIKQFRDGITDVAKKHAIKPIVEFMLQTTPPLIEKSKLCITFHEDVSEQLREWFTAYVQDATGVYFLLNYLCKLGKPQPHLSLFGVIFISKYFRCNIFCLFRQYKRSYIRKGS